MNFLDAARLDEFFDHTRLHFDSNLRDQWPLYDVPCIDGLGKILITPIMSAIGQKRTFTVTIITPRNYESSRGMFLYGPHASNVQPHMKGGWDQTIVSQLATFKDDREGKFRLRS